MTRPGHLKGISDLTIRRLTPADIPQAGEILHLAFNEVFVSHGYPPPISDVPAGRSLAGAYRDHEPDGSFAAIQDGRVVGSAFFHRRGDRVGVGPVTVDPEYQGRGVGRRLMERVIEEVGAGASIRLFQDAFNRESFALYVRLGFVVRDVMVMLRAEPPRFEAGAGCCREMKPRDLPGAAACDLRLTGIDRPRDLAFLLEHGPAAVLEREGTILGFAQSFVVKDALFLGPAAAPTVRELVQLAAAVTRQAGARLVSVRAPSRPGELLAELLQAGFRVRSLGTYMVRGHYEEPPGAYLTTLFPEAL